MYISVSYSYIKASNVYKRVISIRAPYLLDPYKQSLAAYADARVFNNDNAKYEAINMYKYATSTSA